MRLRTQHRVAALIGGLSVLIVLLAIHLSARSLSQAIDESNYAGSINANGISGLRTVTIEYILHPGERARKQWWQRHESLEAQLAREVFDDAPEIAIVKELRSRHRYLAEIFPKLTDLYAQREAGSGDPGQMREVEARLATQILVATEDMVSDATRLLLMSHTELRGTQHWANLFIASTVALMGLLIAATLAFAIREIVGPITTLRHGAEIIGRGNLAYRTGIRTGNEIGDLSRAFDDMAERLAASYSSLREKTTQLEESNRELESFSYSVSHDLRAPLRGIDGWALAFTEDLGDHLDASTREQLGFIRAEAQRMGRLIDDLLQLARVNRYEFLSENVDLTAIAQIVVQRLQRAEPGRRIEFVVQPGLAARGDARLLEIALSNLLDNGAKFTARRDDARVEVGRTVTAAPGSGAHGVFFVRDNGVGFDMAHAGKLFSPFQRMHRANEFPGSGIGLATVQRIIHRHGGRIWAESRRDRGSIFYFTLREAA